MVPDGIDPSTAIRNTMTAQGVGINGTSPFSLSDTATATVADTYSASLSKGVNYAQVEGPEGEFDRIEWTLTVSSPVPAGATITDVADNRGENGNFPNVFNNGDMMDPDVTKLCIMNGNNIASTLERGVDYDLTWQGSQMVLTFLKPVTGISKENPLRFFYRTQLIPTDDMYTSMSQPTFPTGDSDHSFNGLNYCSAGNKATLNVNGLTATAENRTTVNGGFEKYNGTYDSASREIQWKAGLYWNSHNGYVIQGERTVTENIAEDQVISRVTDANGNEIPYTVSEDGRTVTFKVNWRPNDKNDFVYVYTKLNEQYLIEHGQDPDNLTDYEVKNTASVDAFGTQVAAGATAKVTETGTLTKDYKYSHLTEQNENGVEFTLNVNPNASDLDPESDTITIQDIMNRSLVLNPDTIRINGQTIADFGQGAALRYTKNSNHFELVLPDGVACKVTYAAKIVGAVQGEDGWLSNTAQIEGRPGKATIDETSTPRLEVGAGAFSAVPFFVKKLDGDQQLVSGAEFMMKRVDLINGALTEVDAIDSDGEIVSTSNDNLDGTYRWIGLLPTTPAEMGGKGYVYVITEIKAPTGCELDNTPKYIAFAEPSDEMKQALTDAGKTLSMVSGGGANNVAGMFAFNDDNIDDTVDVVVNKEWADNDNSEGFRPTEITVNLIKNYDVDNPLNTVKIKADKNGNWSYTFKDLPKYETKDAQRSEVAYTITENAVNEYTTNVSGNVTDGYTVTNSHEVAKTSIQGLKFWNDKSNEQGKRPTTITVGVFADGSDEPIETKEITAAQNASASDPNYWTFTFDNLNKYKNDGNHTPIKYTVKEIGSLDFYESTQEGTSDTNYTIKNDYNGKTIIVDKVDEQGNPVSGADLQLEKVVETDGGDEGDTEPELEIEALDDGSTIAVESWKTNGTGHEIQLAPGDYVLSEANAPAGYDKSDPIYFTVDADGKVTITNNTGSVAGDNLNIIKMVDKHSTVSVTVNKEWNDANNADGVRPGSLTVQLLADEVETGDPQAIIPDANGNWTYTFNGLAQYAADGHVIKYTVKEVDLDANYSAEDEAVQTDSNGNVTINLKNKHVQEVTEVTVYKVWDDSDNNDGNRPSSVELGVYDADSATGDPVAKATVTKDEATADNANKWSHTFTNLPKNKNVDGTSTAINYVVRELDANGQAQLNNTLTANPNYSVTYDDATKTATNYNPPKRIDVKVTKEWSDNNNQDGARPDSVTVHLKADGELKDPDQTVTLSEANGWTASFTDLLANKNVDGVVSAIEYTVVEDAVTGYTAEVTGTAATGYIVTNTHETAKTSVSCTKVWNDVNNQDGKRPGSVTFGLYDADDMTTTVETVTLNADNAKPGDANTWEYKFEDLDANKVKDGTSTAINYVVRELDANGNPIDANNKLDKYTVTYNVANTEVTNSYTPATGDLNGTKTWVDNANQDGKRPTSIHVQVLDGNNNVVAENDFTGGATDETWSYSFTGLPKYKDGQPVTYHVVETAVEGYTTDIQGANITNTHTPEEVSVSCSKVWNDKNNQDGVRPGTVVMGVYNTDDLNHAVQDVTLTKTHAVAGNANEWTYTFNNLPKYESGIEITYAVYEVAADGKAITAGSTDVTGEYTVGINGNTITNTHEIAKTDVSVNKVWNDRGNKENKRPASIQFQLMANGVAQGDPVTVTPNDRGEWSYTFSDLDKNAAGNEINYTVDEIQVDQYNKAEITGNATDGYTVTNNETSRKVVINKVNEDDVAVADCTLAVTAQGEADSVETWTTTNEGHEMQLKPGDYVLSEVQPAPGYDTADNIEFTVNDDGTITCATNPATGDDLNIVTMIDTLSVYTVNVAKVDGNKNPLAGAELKITGSDMNGNEIEAITWTSTEAAYEAQLSAGKYVLTETKVPDASKYQVAQDIEFEVTPEGAVLVNGEEVAAATITMVDEFVPSTDEGKGTTKKSAKTGDPLNVAGLLGFLGLSAGVTILARRKMSEN